MSDYNSTKNCVVWCDIPVADLERACAFYAAVLANNVQPEEHDGRRFAVLDHEDGNGACLFLEPDHIAGNGGLLVYFNVNGRIRDAVAKVQSAGGEVLEPMHAIGPFGFRVVVLDSEGNRIALHSNSDA